MQQTEHYELNQWDPTDRILREDFNADNAKLDAALAGKAGKFQLIREVKPIGDFITGMGKSLDAEFKDWELIIYIFTYPESEQNTSRTITYSVGVQGDSTRIYELGTTPIGPALIAFWPQHDGEAVARGLILSKELSTFHADFSFSEITQFYISAENNNVRFGFPRSISLGMK